MTKYIFVTGGVVSGLGKGITAASLGRLLKSRGLRVAAQKLDPYINVDPGTMSPYQHGEVYVTEDGAETDLDLGHYERFIDESLTKNSNVTTGKIYWSVLQKERRGDFGGGTVQVIPHITNEIKSRFYRNPAATDTEIAIIEVGGTVGDIESQPFLESIRQFQHERGSENVILIHVTLIPYLKASQEMKTKPTQASVKELQGMGIQPDIIVCRSEYPLDDGMKNKISLFCNLPADHVLQNLDVEYLYEAPLAMEKEHLAQMLTIARDYARARGFKGTFLIEPKPMEPTKHQYDVDTETVIGFLKAHGLDKDFKVNIEVNHATLAGHTFEHELAVAVDNGMLGSIDANRGDYQNGWDTDQFPIDNYELTQAMMQIIRNGGLGTGGTNFDAKTRRNSTDLEDIFIAHIAGMDAMARALESAAALLDESPYKKMLADRYASFDGGKGKEFEDGKLTLEDVVAYAKTKGEPKQTSGKQELYEAILNMYC